MFIFLRRSSNRATTNGRKTALVTGASSGIGEATALFMAERGYHVLGTSRSVSRLEALRREATDRELPITPVELDINSDEAVEAAMPALLDEHGPVDVLVNNAGYGLWGPVGDLSMAELKSQFETNVFAAVRMTHAVLPGMMERRHGTIINVSSILGRLGTPFNGAYVASKFALEGLSESMRIELWPFGVRVAVVEPGGFRTKFQENQVVEDRVHSEDSAFRRYIQKYQARHDRFARFSGDPVKVAKVIHKIASSRRPRLRYPVGLDARAGMAGARFLPERLFQALMARAIMR